MEHACGIPKGSLNTWLNLEWQGQEEARPSLPTPAPYPAQPPQPEEQPWRVSGPTPQESFHSSPTVL